MRKSFFHPDEFFVGYLPKAPAGIGSFYKRIVPILVVVVLLAALLLAYYQRAFSSAEFDYGIDTSVTGYFHSTPVPHLRVPLGKQIDNKSLYQTLLLVGFGKNGAHDAIAQLSQTHPHLEGALTTWKGNLIYGDGKALLQVNDASLTNHIAQSEPDDQFFQSMGNRNISGEIVDPKCYFGVMKPGEGKAHRSCAIRCLAGGIPPVFKSINPSEYFLLVDENLAPAGKEILPLVGDSISWEGEVIQWGDWKLFKVSREKIYSESRLHKNSFVPQEDIRICELDK